MFPENYQNPGAGPQPAPESVLRMQNRAAGKKLLFRLGLAVGAALMGYMLLRSLFVVLLTRFAPLRNFYAGSKEGEIAVNMFYSYFIVGVPFLVLWLCLRKQKGLAFRMPLGGVYNGKTAALLVFAGVGVCFLGDIATNYFALFADSVGVTFYSYQEALKGETVPQNAFGIVLFILQGALVPAMVEEFAFRGVILQPLRKFGDWFAILVTAVLFGLLHGNMTQMPFAIIAGVALGYCAVVSGSLWVSILIHFLNNLFAVSSSLILDRCGTAAGLIFSNVCLYGFLGLGVLAFVLYAVRNRAWARLYPGEYAYAPRGSFFAAPTLLLALFWLTALTLSDIQVLAPFFNWA